MLQKAEHGGVRRREPAGTLIELRSISKNFGSYQAVDDVSMSIGHGEFVTLLGASGSGKTTTLRLITELDMPSSGTIWFQGQDITDVPATHRDMRMVFQDYALFPFHGRTQCRLRIERGFDARAISTGIHCCPGAALSGHRAARRPRQEVAASALRWATPARGPCTRARHRSKSGSVR